jgi:hypothetical protein
MEQLMQVFLPSPHNALVLAGLSLALAAICAVGSYVAGKLKE